MTEPVRPLEALVAAMRAIAADNRTSSEVPCQCERSWHADTYDSWADVIEAALLHAAAPPAPTADPTIDEQVLRDLETRIFYAETSLKALVDSARLWKSLASTPAAPPAPQPASVPPQTQMADAAEMLWVVLANVSGGDWTKQSADWQKYAAKWRDNYFAAVKAASMPVAPPAPTAEQEQQPICVACSGCGWCEGSPAFTCPVCKGTGHVH
jgi:hypothetical protein